MFWLREAISIHIDFVGILSCNMTDNISGSKDEMLSETTSFSVEAAFFNSMGDVVFGPQGYALAL